MCGSGWLERVWSRRRMTPLSHTSHLYSQARWRRCRQGQHGGQSGLVLHFHPIPQTAVDWPADGGAVLTWWTSEEETQTEVGSPDWAPELPHLPSWCRWWPRSQSDLGQTFLIKQFEININQASPPPLWRTRITLLGASSTLLSHVGNNKIYFYFYSLFKEDVKSKKSLPLACSHPGHHGTVLSVSVRWRLVQTVRSLWSTRED